MAKSSPKRDKEREHRILMDIVVDAHDEEERAMGWYYYLAEQLAFPFSATCIAKRAISPLRVKKKVEVIDLAGADECERKMFVMIPWNDDPLAVPLSQVKPSKGADEETKRAVADWHYWEKMGYEF